MSSADGFVQESGLAVFERWRNRPSVSCCLNKKISNLDITGKIIEISGPYNKTKMACKIAKSALHPGEQNQVLILDCDGGIKVDQIMQNHTEQKDLENRISLYRIFDWNEYQMALARLPDLLFKLPQVNMILIDGLSNPYLSLDTKKLQHGNLTQHISRLHSILEPYNVTCVVTVSNPCSGDFDFEKSKLIRISLSSENGKCLVQDASTDESIEMDFES